MGAPPPPPGTRSPDGAARRSRPIDRRAICSPSDLFLSRCSPFARQKSGRRPLVTQGRAVDGERRTSNVRDSRRRRRPLAVGARPQQTAVEFWQIQAKLRRSRQTDRQTSWPRSKLIEWSRERERSREMAHFKELFIAFNGTGRIHGLHRANRSPLHSAAEPGGPRLRRRRSSDLGQTNCLEAQRRQTLTFGPQRQRFELGRRPIPWLL